jgi:hypothetical protein
MKILIKYLFVFLFLLLITPIALCEGSNEKSLVLGKVHIKSSSGKTILSEAKVELLEPSSKDKTGKVLFGTYTDNSGVFGFYDVPYGTYELRVSLGRDTLTQQFINDEGAEIETQKRSIEINKPRVKIPEIVVSKKIILTDFSKSYYKIIAGHSSQCLDVKGAEQKKGARVQQWPCHDGDNQLFTLVAKKGNYYNIVAKHSGQCLDVKGANTKKGARVQQWPCHDGDNQLFSIVAKKGDYYNIVAKHSGQCLDVKGANTKKGAKVQQWPCHGADNQLWRIK